MAEVPSGQRCENCRFWREYEEAPPQFDDDGNEFLPGQCRRYPPSGPDNHGDGGGYRSRTFNTSWCGEWQAANPETLPEGVPVLIAFAQAGDLVAARALADKLRE